MTRHMHVCVCVCICVVVNESSLYGKITDIVSFIDFCPLYAHTFKLTMQTQNVDNKHFSSCARVVLSVAAAFNVIVVVVVAVDSAMR